MRDAFMKALAADPMDVATRMAFSDWCLENGFDDEAEVRRAWTPEKHREAVQHVEMLAGILEESFHNVMAHAESVLAVDKDEGWWEYITTQGFDSSEHTGPEFWGHFETLTGIPVPSGKRGRNFISCSC